MHSNNEKIAAIVVTYNRKHFLGECLNALISQSKKIDKIYVVDNCSTDGTTEYLMSLGLLRHADIHYVRLNENTGGSGGFSYGVKEAYNAGYNWFWLMDDDVEAYPRALEQLLNFSEISHCIHGVRTEPNGGICKWGHNFDPLYVLAKPIESIVFKNTDSYISLNVGCFEGMLINRDVIDKIGFPDEEYFITWDDTIYGYLASLHTKTIYANVLSLKRKRPTEFIDGLFRSKYTTVSPLASYFYQRNRFIIASKLNTIGWRFWMGTIKSLIVPLVKDGLLNRNIFKAKRIIAGFVAGFKYINRNDNIH